MKTVVVSLFILALQVFYIAAGLAMNAPSPSTTAAFDDPQTRAGLQWIKCLKKSAITPAH